MSGLTSNPSNLDLGLVFCSGNPEWCRMQPSWCVCITVSIVCFISFSHFLRIHLSIFPSILFSMPPRLLNGCSTWSSDGKDHIPDLDVFPSYGHYNMIYLFYDLSCTVVMKLCPYYSQRQKSSALYAMERSILQLQFLNIISVLYFAIHFMCTYLVNGMSLN